ncbi:haloalkane dehalogenase [Desulfomarina profundi]|uniref:Haloalkane dehalogenase n=1 Tax=Desulfomarina profundi TaxID=2772557 RepID=A0A8D5JP47_9BACT|nr:alpha/beta fold hydrolase [Desulfomarina profundi]BCL60875.1 haloalkane dehalogenase [Desulfomarina profundi]
MKTKYPEYPFKSRFLSLKDGNLHYIDEGQGPVVIMVHGNPTWSYYYRRLISLLRKQYRVIAPDHLGCGLSDKPADYQYNLAGHIDNLAELLKHLKIKRFSMVVHDWGGAIGFGYAVDHPEMIERLVVMNSAAFRSNRMPLRIGICRIPLLGDFLVRKLNGFAGSARFMAVRKKLPEKVAAAYLAPYDSWENRIAVFRFVKDIPMNKRHPSYNRLVAIENGLERLKKRNIPCFSFGEGRIFASMILFSTSGLIDFLIAKPIIFLMQAIMFLKTHFRKSNLLLRFFLS